MNNDDQTQYNYYINTRNNYIEKQYDQCRQYDQSMFLLSSGVFGITISFLGDIIELPKQNTKYLIICGWSLVIVSICISLIAYIINYYAHKREIENIDISIKNLVSELKILSKPNIYTQIAEFMNNTNLVFLISGLVFIIIYISSNI